MHCRLRLISALMTACLASSAPVFAQSTTGRGASAGRYSGPEVSVDQLANVRPLKLDQAIALGVRNNLDVEVNRYQPYISQLDSEAAWGAYDPLFEGDVTFGDQIAPANSLFNVNQLFARGEQFGGTAGLTALIPYVGAAVNVAYDSTRSKTNMVFQTLSPEYESGLTIGANVPLMRGLIWNEPWTQVKTSRLLYDAELDNFTTSIMNVAQQIIAAYWELVATKEQVRVAEKSLESNQALLDQTETQYEVGVVSKVEVVQAEAGV
ncbi:MAG: TolC family protein, partial [Deltaproteobacteria bacterium]|nr:TolC family protein [Deltaproteobacteria bacterium]